MRDGSNVADVVSSDGHTTLRDIFHEVFTNKLGIGLGNDVLLNPAVALEDAAEAANELLIARGFTYTLGAEEILYLRNAQYADYFLNSRSSVVQLECLELTHPAFSKVYRIVRNAAAGVTVTLETGGTAVFTYYPAKITPSKTQEDLDFGLNIAVGDLGVEFPVELDRVLTYPGGVGIKPQLIYRTYRSDDLSKPLYGPLSLEVSALGFNQDGVTFEARAPALNANRTGEIYSLTRFPMLRGFI